MVEFDRRRAARIVGETIESIDAMIAHHQSDGAYTSPEQMLEKHVELVDDFDTMVALKEHLEQDCE